MTQAGGKNGDKGKVRDCSTCSHKHTALQDEGVHIAGFAMLVHQAMVVCRAAGLPQALLSKAVDDWQRP